MSKGFWKIFPQYTAVSRMSGWGELVKTVNAIGRPVSQASSDATPADIQNNATNIGNVIMTEDRQGYRFGFDYRFHATEEAAHIAWKEFVKARWNNYKQVIPLDVNPAITAVSIENEQAGWLGWKQEFDTKPALGSIPGFTGWGDCEGWQAYYTAVEMLKESHPWRYFAFAYSAGLPEYGVWKQPGMKIYLELCEKYPDRFGIALHEYSLHDNLFWDATFGKSPTDAIGHHVFRFKHLFNACDQMGIKRPRVQITEFGYHQNKLAPSEETTKQQLLQAAEVYAHYPEIELVALWTASNSWKPVNTQVESLIPYMKKQASTQVWDIEEAPPPIPPQNKPKIVIVKVGQEHGLTAWLASSTFAYNNYKRTMTASHDDMVTMMKAGNTESYVVLVDPAYPSQQQAEKIIKANSWKYEVQYIDHPPTPTVEDILQYRPCDTELITQRFGENPDKYKPFGLPGHEAIDFAVQSGSPFYAAQDGIVEYAGDKTLNGLPSRYGWHVYLRHNVKGTQFVTVYAHARKDLQVTKGEAVSAGEILGYSGNSGASTGYHEHFGILWPTNTGNGYPMWTFGQPIDPYPYLKNKPAPAPPIVKAYDMLPYLCGDGRMYEVRHLSGATEIFQSQKEGKTFYQVKNNQYETLRYDDTYIWRGLDTSPGPAPLYAERPGVNRMYTQREEGATAAKWLKRYMREGETFTEEPQHWVQFGYKDNCQNSNANSGPSRNVVTFSKQHDLYQFGNITLVDVIQIQTNTGETMFYAKDFGLVAWGMERKMSMISKFITGRPDLVREPGCFTEV
jgi:murein DD-endopeptidase MepM/ murein hydrolase activator NlpD